MFFRFVTKNACDRQNYDPQDRASIAASRGKNEIEGGLLDQGLKLYVEKAYDFYEL